MERSLYEKFLELERKVNGENIAVLCDSPALAEEHGVRLGDTVICYKPPDSIASVDDCLKYMHYQDFFHKNPSAMLSDASGVL